VPIVTLRLAELTAANLQAACGLEVKPEQRQFVAPVVESYVHYATAWPRLILDDDRVVGFIMGGFNPHSEVDVFRCPRLLAPWRHQE
jgi:diamine N-acetyltransferase